MLRGVSGLYCSLIVTMVVITPGLLASSGRLLSPHNETNKSENGKRQQHEEQGAGGRQLGAICEFRDKGCVALGACNRVATARPDVPGVAQALKNCRANEAAAQIGVCSRRYPQRTKRVRARGINKRDVLLAWWQMERSSME